jgi:hypothetical protein
MRAKAVPDDLLLTETDNPGDLKWLKNDVGMPKSSKPWLRCENQRLRRSNHWFSQTSCGLSPTTCGSVKLRLGYCLQTRRGLSMRNFNEAQPMAVHAHALTLQRIPALL